MQVSAQRVIKALHPEWSQERVDEEFDRLFVDVNGYTLFRVHGASPDEDDDSDETDTSDESDDDSDDDDSDTDDLDDDDDDDDDDGHVRMPKSEAERLRRIASEADKAKREAERERRKREEKEKRDRGEYEELLSERDEKITEVEAERDEARFQLSEYKRQIMVRAVGVRLGLRDPEDLVRFLPEDETESEQDTERAAKRLLRERPYLKAERQSTGMPGGNGAEVDGMTFDDLKKMTPDQINANWPQVTKVLEESGKSLSDLRR